MQLTQVLELLNQDDQLFRYGSEKFSERDDICIVDDQVPLPIILPTSFPVGFDVDIVDHNGQVLGWICNCKTLGQVDVNLLTNAKYAAYINEVNINSFTGDYIFSNDYAVIKNSHYDEYKTKYLKSAPVWGGFLHISPLTILHPSYKTNFTEVKAINEISLPTEHHRRSVAQSVIQAYGFERFLKLYHLLELLFDYDMVKEIQELQDDLYGIGKILENYAREELWRLKTLLKKRCLSDALFQNEMETHLNRIGQKQEYLDKSIEIFYRYGKDGNPIKEESKFSNLMKAGGFSEANARSVGITINADRTYKMLIIDTGAYWIYRIRCCVAHNRIGEYVITDNDEEFVVECMEPLMRSLLCQAFSTGHPKP